MSQVYDEEKKTGHVAADEVDAAPQYDGVSIDTITALVAEGTHN